jgi:hypothetical protein
MLIREVGISLRILFEEYIKTLTLIWRCFFNVVFDNIIFN